jgi:hypothetical protein
MPWAMRYVGLLSVTLFHVETSRPQFLSLRHISLKILYSLAILSSNPRQNPLPAMGRTGSRLPPAPASALDGQLWAIQRPFGRAARGTKPAS